MAILDYNSTIRTTAGGETTSAIITAATIGQYGISTTSTYYIGTTQNVFNRASGAQTLTGVSIDGNAATVTNGLTTTNYSSYALPISGGTMTGVLQSNKPINASGATYGSQATYVGNWSGTGWWGLGSESGHILKFDQVAYADVNSPTWIGATDLVLKLGTKFVRDSYYRTISGIGDYYASGASGWYTVASITLTTNCTGGVLYGTLYDHRYDGADAYQISIVARAECDFTTNNESHYVNVGCTILGSTNITNYQSKIRVLLVASAANSRTYEVQFLETAWNRDTWQLETSGSPVWTIYSTAQAPGTSTGTARVFYISNQNADNIRANNASYSPVYYDSNDTSYYSDPAGLNRFNALNIGNQGALTGNTTYALGAYHNSRYMVGLRYSSGGAAYPWLVHDSWNGSAFVIHFNGVGDKFNFSESGIGQAGGDFRAPVFYDSNNTSYYIDPASTSIVNSFKVYDALYFGDYTTYISQATPYLKITTPSGYGNFGSANSSWFHMTTDRPNFYMAVGLHINGDLFIYNTQSQLTSTSVRAPIFYDSGDTTYYLDPANTGTSLLVAGKVGIGITSPVLKLQVDAAPGNPATTGTTQNGIFRISNSTDNAVLDFGMRAAGAGAWLQSTDETSLAANYPLLLNPNGANVGINNLSADTNLQVVGHVHVGNQTTFDNTGGWNKTIYLDGTTHARMRILGSAFASGKNSATETSIWVDNSVSPYSGLDTNAGSFRISAGFTTLTNSARSPIFYDSDNTSYYIDAASTSNLNVLVVAANARVGGAGSRSSYGLTVGFTDNTAFAANTDVGDTVRTLSVVNDSSTTNAMAVLGFRVNPNGATANAMLDIKFVQTGATNTSALYYTFNHGGTFADRLTIQSSGNIGVNTSDFTYTSNDNSRLVGSNTNNRLFVNGSIQLLNNNDAIVIGRATATFLSDEELGFGWGGGWYMTDVTYLRVRNDKVLYSAGEIWGSIFKDSNDTTYYLDPANTTLSLKTRSSIVINNASAPNNHAMLNIGYNGSGETRAIDIQGGWSGGENKSITFTHAGTTSDIVAQINAQHNGPASRLRWGKLYHGGNSSTYTMELISESTTSAYLTVAGSVRAPIFYDSNNTAYYIDPASTSVLNALTVGGNNVLTTASTLTAGNLSGTIPSAVLGNSTLYVGTTAIALNRTSASQSLTGVNIDGNAGGSSTFVASLGSSLNYDIDRTTKRSGLSHYSGYSTGTNRPTTYDYTLQVTDGNKGWEISMDWIATTGPAIYARSLRDCCQNWSSWVRILDSANYTYAANMNQYVRTTDNVTFVNVTGAIFYDAANTAYYIDPASTSNLVGLTVANTITGSISGNAATATTATNSNQLGGVAAANYVRNDVDGSNSTALFRLTTITKSLTITTSWLDTGIVGADLSTGCYMISLYVDNYAVNGGHYQETYTGMMSWFSTGTNSTDYDEIVLHKSGHAPNGAYINLRTIRQLSGGTNLKLQIISSVSTNGASNYIFKFRRLI